MARPHEAPPTSEGATMKLTPWYPPGIKPVHEGPYLMEKWPGYPKEWYRAWRDGSWYTGAPTPKGAMSSNTAMQMPTYRGWRGLTKRSYDAGGKPKC